MSYLCLITPEGNCGGGNNGVLPNKEIPPNDPIAAQLIATKQTSLGQCKQECENSQVTCDALTWYVDFGFEGWGIKIKSYCNLPMVYPTEPDLLLAVFKQMLKF